MVPYQVVRNKMHKMSVLLENPKLAPYVPETVFYSPKTLERMLNIHGLVFVKPNKSKGGKRVIAIKKDGTGSYRMHFNTHTASRLTLPAAVSLINGIAGEDQFIVQKGIEVLRVNNRPIELRVNVQKPYDRWLVTGIIAKIAAAGKIVTNHLQGGTLASPEQTLLQAGLEKKEIGELNHTLHYLGHKASVILNKKFPGLRELGLDVAVDRTARPWILEVNTNPQYNRHFDNYGIINTYHQTILNRHHR